MARFSSFRRARCKHCGRSIVWAKNPATGSVMPLDPDALTFRVWITPKGDAEYQTEDAEVDGGVMVTHFATCPFIIKAGAKSKTAEVQS